MSNFSDNYLPIKGPTGVIEITLAAGAEWTMAASGTIPPTANRATLSASGGRVHYYVNGSSPSSNFGRPCPDGEEVLLNNIEMLKDLKIRQAEDDCSATICFYNSGD